MSESVLNPDSNSEALRKALQSAQSQLAALTERVAGLENPTAPVVAAPSGSVAKAETSSATSSVAKQADLSDEELLAVSAAIGAWLGVHAHIRQIRLLRTDSWPHQGRVTIQASHRLNRLKH